MICEPVSKEQLTFVISEEESADQNGMSDYVKTSYYQLTIVGT